MAKKVTIHHFRKHVHKRLQMRLLMYVVISILLLLFVAYEVIAGQVNFLFVLLALGIGFAIGLVIARMFNLQWDKDVERVVSRIDRFGVILIIVYIGFSFLRRQILGDLFAGNQLIGMSLALAAGLMLGRMVGIGKKITRILREEGIV